MSGDEESARASPRIKSVQPTTLEPSDQHAAPDREPDDQLTASIENVGVVEPPTARVEHGDLRLLDGVRRAKAAAEAGHDQIPVLVRDLDDTDALALSIQANCAGWDTKTVTDSDRQRSLNRVAEMTDRSVDEVEREIGLLSEADRIGRACEDIPGVGPATAEALADIGLTLEDLREAQPVKLTEADGVGETTAFAIWQHFDRGDDGMVITHA